MDGSRSKIGEIGVDLSVREKGKEPSNEFERGVIRGVSGEWSEWITLIYLNLHVEVRQTFPRVYQVHCTLATYNKCQ
jgi:hypothetical protein